MKHADWDAIVAAHRRQVTSGTTPDQLFDILQDMIRPFNDAHTDISASKPKRHYEGFRPGTEQLRKQIDSHGRQKLLDITDRTYIHGTLRKFCRGKLQYGHIDADTGYLTILAFGGYTKQSGFAAGLMALEAALDEIFSDSSLHALILDLRLNFGGDDPYGLAVASRLATQDYLAYSKYARADPVDRDRWTPGDPSMVHPSSRPSFHGPVVELTGPLTISAGETFTQALMGRTPAILRIGENTQGVFSDVLDRHLPNGWTFALPNEIFRSPDGRTFDVAGVPPDIVVPVFAAADIAAKKDPGVAMALQVLRRR